MRKINELTFEYYSFIIGVKELFDFFKKRQKNKRLSLTKVLPAPS